MPYLDQLFQKEGLRAYGEPQCYDAKVVAVTPDVLVVLPNFDPHLRWGPCKPAGSQVQIGDEVAVAISEAGTVWLLGLAAIPATASESAPEPLSGPDAES